MKVLKRLKSGLIVHEDFSTEDIQEPLMAGVNFIKGDGYIDINGGSIDINTYPYPNLVFEIGNSFVPDNNVNIGGIRVLRGTEKREFFEYYNPQESITVPYAKVVKNGDVYTGYHSQNEKMWDSKGYVVFNDADTIGVSIDSVVPYRLNFIKVYLSDYISIYQVMPGWRIEVIDDENTTIINQNINDSIVHLNLLKYPFSGTFKIYDNQNELICDYDMSGIWGGDDYFCTVNVDLYTNLGVPLIFEDARHLGALESSGIMEGWLIARNNNNVETVVTISVADYSPFGNWVTLAPDINGEPGEYAKSINLTIPANSDLAFWYNITKDVMMIDFAFEYKKTECLFYITVE